MKPYCLGEVWRIKLVLTVVAIFFAGSETEGTSIADGIEIRGLSGNHRQFNGGASQIESRHRGKMLFPLLLNISSRLAQIVSMALAAVTATFIMAFFAKKAFLISLATLGLVIYEKFTKKSHIFHYHVKPLHKNYIIDNYFVTSEPHKYAGYANAYHAPHRQQHYSRHKMYEDGSDFIFQDI